MSNISNAAGNLPGDTRSLMAIAAITIIAGIIGGIAAYLAEPKPAEPASQEPPKRTLSRFLLLGVIAAACVPLFLSLLQSKLLEKILGGALTTTAFENYLIFMGLCLVAAFSARRFIDSVTQQVIRKAEEANRNAERAVETANQAHETAVESLNEVESVDSDEPPPAMQQVALQPGETNAPVSVDAEERRALVALSRKTYRTRTGVAEDAGIARHRISEVLESLAERMLALPTRSPKTGGARWLITDRGRVAIDAPP